MNYKQLLELSKKYPNCTSLDQLSIYSKENRDKESVERNNKHLSKAYKKRKK